MRRLLLDQNWTVGDGRELLAPSVRQCEIIPGTGGVRKTDRGIDDAIRALMIGARAVVDRAARAPGTFIDLPHRVG